MNMMLAPFHMSFSMVKVYARIGALYIDKHAKLGVSSLCILYVYDMCICVVYIWDAYII